MNEKRIILIAGVPRSGSSWLFNAARKLFEASDTPAHAAWISDWDRTDPSPTHLIKVHRPEHVDFQPDLVLTTLRPPEECLASLVRMGWVKPDADSIGIRWKNHNDLYAHWNRLSSLEIGYDEITGAPETAVVRIGVLLGIALQSSESARIAKELQELKPPEEGVRYDSTTLLHPGHRKIRHEEGLTPEDILRIVNT